MQSMREQANKYLESRITFADTNINTKASGGNKEFDLQPGQPDFAAGVVALNDGARRSLPIVAFPTIKGSAASAGALGGYGFLRSFGLAVGSSEQVELDFTDTRAFGVPLGAAAASGKYEKEYTNTVCAIIDKQRNRNLAEIGFQRLGLVAESVDVPKEEMCGEGRICDIAVITRTYLTRRVVFTYSSARVARLAAAARRSPAPEDAKTVPIPGNLSVDITLAPDPDGTQIKDLVNGLSSAVTSSGGEDIESSALSFLGFQGNSIAFQRVYLKPVAIAYDSINFNLKGGPETCGVAPPKVED
ncbi:MAG: hypothetical protein QNJ16_13525 [Rhodobacter sp.]|nr:hypothetical protein [Rhodobacter sp.]